MLDDIGDKHISAPQPGQRQKLLEELARRTGIDPVPISLPGPPDRRAALLRGFFDLCQREFLSDRGVEARAYLEQRGLPVDSIEATGLGLVPPRSRNRESGARQRKHDNLAFNRVLHQIDSGAYS